MSSRRKALVVASAMVGTCLAALDATIIGMNVPSLMSSLGGLPFYTWTFSAYLLASTIAVPAYGKLADIYGRRPLYLFGTALFLFGSILCSLAQTMEQLILFRATQGLGAGAMIPTTFTIIADTFSSEQRARVQGLLGAVWGMAGILGPAVGVFIVENLGWHWAFLINIPFGFGSATVLALALRERGTGTTRRAVDYWGAATFAVGTTILLSTLLDASIKEEGLSLDAAGMLAISAVSLGLFALIECTTKEPMLPLSLFVANKTVRSCSIAGLVTGMAMLGAISYVPLFSQGVMGGAGAATAAVLIPLGLGWPVGSAVAGCIVLRLGYRCAVIIGATVVFLGSLMLTMLDTSSTATFAGAAMAALGLGLGFSTTSVLVAVQNSVAADQQGIATSSVQFFRTIGGIIGVSVLALLLNSQITGSFAATLVSAPLDRTFPSSGLDTLLEPEVASGLDLGAYLLARDALAYALHSVFWGILGFAILALVASLFIPGKDLSTKLAEQPQVEES